MGNFSRHRIPAEAGQVIEDGQNIKPYSAEFGSFKSGRHARDTAPYQPGDLIWAETSAGHARVCKVLGLTAWLTRAGEWIPIYKCLYATQAGRWSRDFRRVSPGDNYRAHFAKADDPQTEHDRNLPLITTRPGLVISFEESHR